MKDLQIFNRNRWIWGLAIGVLALGGAVALRAGPAPEADDWAHYILHAQAMAEGRSYTDTGYLFSPYSWGTGPPARSPGLPAALVPLVWVGASVEAAAPWLMMVSLLFFLGVAAARIGRDSPVLAAGVALWSVAALVSQGALRGLGPDTMFAGLLWVVVLAADSDGGWGWDRVALITVAGAAALALRTAALPVIPAIALYWILHPRKLGWRPLVPLAVWSGWFWWLFEVLRAGRVPAIAGTSGVSDGEAGPAGSAIADLLDRVWFNVNSYRLPLFEFEMYPFPWDLANDGYHVAVSLLVVAGLGWWTVRHWNTAAASLLAGTGGMLALAPVTEGRYLWPLYPFLAIGLLTALSGLLSLRFAARSSDLAVRAVVPIVLLSMVGFVLGGAQVSLSRSDDAVRVFDLVERAVAAGREPRVLFFKPGVMTFESGAPSMPLFQSPDADSAFEEVDRVGITHVVLGSTEDEAVGQNRFWSGLAQTRRDRLHPVLESGRFQVFELLPPVQPN